MFLGLSAGGVLTQDMVRQMAAEPADPGARQSHAGNPAARGDGGAPDAVMATGRSDYPNQVNNVLCFPFIFRGALDVGATTITRAMEIAAVHALADLARREQSDVVAAAYGGVEDLSFGPGYLIPKPFDPRLIVKIAPAVAKAAMDSGVARRPIADLDAYSERLQQFVYHSGTLMQPIYAAARKIAPERSRIVYAEGEDERVLRAVQIAVDEKFAVPDAHRTAVGDRAGHQALRTSDPDRRAFDRRQSRPRRALPRILAGVSPAHAQERRDPAVREARDAAADHADRRDAA